MVSRKDESIEETSCELTIRFLDSELTPVEMLALESHLSVCSHCRVKLESESASDAFWGETQQFLLSQVTDLIPTRCALALNSICENPVQILGRSLDPLANDPFQDGVFSTSIERTASVSQWLDPSTETGSIGRIGKYEVQSIIGQGGMGLVLKAFDTELNRPVALKTIASFLTNSDDQLRLIREARTIATLRHPHVVPIYGIEKWRDVPVLVMPLINGGTLQQAAQRGRLSVPQMLDVGEQIADALSGLHQIGIVHRDVKPSNILLQDGLRHVLLSDFGLARAGSDSTITFSNVLAGTPHFMSPEQSLGLPLDHRSDLFSLGSVLFWLCTGEYPFRGNSQYETLSFVVKKEADFQLLDEQGVPDLVQRVIRGLLEKDPARRWQTSEEVGKLLRLCKERQQDSDFVIPEMYSSHLEQKQLPSTEDLLPTSSGQASTSRPVSARSYLVPMALIAFSGIAIASFLLSRWNGIVDDHSETNQSSEAVISSVETRTERYGSLDSLDRIAIGGEMERGENLLYWLRRLASLAVDETPGELIPVIEKLSEHNDPSIRELANVVLNKNPFQEIMIWENSTVEAADSNINLNENPFVEIEEEKK